MNNNYKSDHTFYGGSALVIQYHDIIKPVYLMAFLKLLKNPEIRHGLQFSHLEKFSIPSIIETYINRSFINPLHLADPGKKATEEQLDYFLKVLLKDTALYQYAPLLETYKMLSIISVNHLGVPIYYYSEEPDQGIQEEIKQEPNINYITGPIESVLTQIPNNWSMILSDIILAQQIFRKAKPNTIGTIMVSSDYQYNFNSKGQYKIDFKKEMLETQQIFLKVKSISIFNRIKIMDEIIKLMEKF